MKTVITIEPGDPQCEAATQLIRELLVEVAGRYSERGDDSGSFTPADVQVPRSVFVIARVDGQPAGCGAIRPLDAETAEVKRMYVAPSVRGRGVGKGVLATLERFAAQFGYRFLRLETGVGQPEAIALYEHFGFYRIPAFGCYIGSPISVCYEKRVNPPDPTCLFAVACSEEAERRRTGMSALLEPNA